MGQEGSRERLSYSPVCPHPTATQPDSQLLPGLQQAPPSSPGARRSGQVLNPLALGLALMSRLPGLEGESWRW